MALNSIVFILFLGIVCVSAYLIPGKYRYVWLLLCSYAFYLYSPDGDFQKNLPTLGLLLLATLLSYICALGISASRKMPAKRFFLVSSLVVTLGMLFACKYLNFFLTSLGILSAQNSLTIILPLGISYYTLQTVGYVIDVYTNTQKAEKNLLQYALFVSFFPSLVTGPINRAGKMLPQYKNPPKFSYIRVSSGLFRVLWGLFKKMVIADNIGVFTAGIFGDLSRRTGLEVIVAVLVFAYQIYADFGGCCDIAIGAARMLGFSFAENFNRPFAAKTYPALWQRWHISLTSFLRDYLFTPLVWARWTEKLPLIGKFFTKPPVLCASVIVFTVSGLWHGANINYIVWGLLNGLFMVASQMLGKKRDKIASAIPLYRNTKIRGFFQRIFVYLMFSFCLIFFASAMYQTPAFTWFAQLGQGWGALCTAKLLKTFGYHGFNTTILIVLAVSITLVELIEKAAIRKRSSISVWIRRRHVAVRWLLYYLLLLGLFVFGAFGRSTFIYQQY